MKTTPLAKKVQTLLMPEKGSTREYRILTDDIPAAGVLPSLYKQLKSLVPFASVDGTRPALCSVAMDLEKEKGAMVATDGRHLVTVPIANGVDFVHTSRVVIFPTQMIALGAKCEFGLYNDGDRYHAAALLPDGRWIISDSTPTYPNYRHVIPDETGYNNSFEFTYADTDTGFLGLEKILIRESGVLGHIGDYGWVSADNSGPGMSPPELFDTRRMTDEGINLDPSKLSLAIDMGHRKFRVRDSTSPVFSEISPGCLYVLMPLHSSAG